MNRTAALFISVILLTQIASYSLNDVQPQIEREEVFQEDSTWDVSGRNNSSSGNNSGPMEWVQTWPDSTIYTTNDIVNISWSAGDLVANITYNVTVDIFAHNSTSNTTYVIWDDYTVFNATSNASSGDWNVPSATLPTGCYFVSVNLFDNSDGMHFANDGFNLDIDMDCSGGSGNNSGPMEWVQTWPDSTIYTTNDIVNISWSAGDLVANITYNVTVDIYAHNSSSNTSYVIWDDYTVFNATINSGWWNVPSATLPTGCYFVSVGLYDNSDGMHLANDGFNLDIDMDCSGGSGNNSGATEWIQGWPESSNYTTEDIPIISWTAGDLVANITYNVTLEIFAHDMATNTDYVIYDDFTVFTATSNADAGLWNVPNGTLPVGCYYVSIALFDDSDGMYFDNDGFELSVETDCSGGSGNNSGATEWINVLFYNADSSQSPYHHYDYAYEVSFNMTMHGVLPGENYNMSYSLSHMNSTSGWTDVYLPSDKGFTGMNGGVPFYVIDGNGNGSAIEFQHQFYAGCWNLGVELFNDDHQLVADHWGEMFTVGDLTACGTNNNNTADSDGDGWSDADESACGTDSTNNWSFPIDTDSDGWCDFLDSDDDEDGYPDWCEQYWGTDPLDPTDFPTQLQDCNNNTGNATDCGTDGNLTDLMVWTDHTIYNEGDTVDATFWVECPLANDVYTLTYELKDSSYNLIDEDDFGPVLKPQNMNNVSYNIQWSNLTADTYCLTATLNNTYQAPSLWIVETYCFDVNSPSTAWDNGTARFIYIKPLAQNADQHTPFNLTFPAPPMADGSPYMSNMICSKAAGHSADVWETYVPMPFNNITSWKVENTYGLVMGMFVMYDAQAAGIYSMQNPTVIFEQNMSFSGHAPSELVDQVYFNCPMVTVSSSLSPVMSPGGSVLSYVAGISVNNSGDWTGDLNWEVATVTNGSSTALTDVAGHLLIESTGALLDHNFNTTGIVADEICLNWELIDESGVELSSGSECIDFTPIDEGSDDVVDRTPRISLWGGKVNQHNENGTWLTDPDGVSGGHPFSQYPNDYGGREVEYCQKFWPSTTQVVLQNHTEDITFYTEGNLVAYNNTKHVWICQTEDGGIPAFDPVDLDNEDNVEDNADDKSGALPAVGVFGTLVASVFAVFIIAIRRDEE